ncbi:adhesion G protein-coupled receptor E3-like [Colossoma macropomum]|uniref:adhesion G protein-coupled receptor E3-like n=1 Tax=Colossoma macropomum TaxID=42526 RepID=UPI0018644BA4|nr:adhesion G protein-coupled receptor E3-like [Colossoma macropomum]
MSSLVEKDRGELNQHTKNRPAKRLSECNLTEDICAVVASALSSNLTSVRELDLTYTILQDSGAMLLFAGLENPHCKLKILRLCDWNLSEESWAALSLALRNSSSLRELDLCKTEQQDVYVKLLSGALENPHCKLEKLRLDRCNLTEDSCAALASALSSSSSADLAPVLKALKSNPSHLRELNVKWSNLRDSGVKELSNLLKDPHCKLEKLQLEQCSITNESCADLFKALESNPSHLRELSLNNNKLGDSGVKELCDLLKDPHCLIIKTLEACKANATLDCTNNLLSQIDNITDQVLPKKDVEDTLNYLITQQNSLITGKTNQDGLVSSFNRMLNATEKLVSTLVKTVETNSSVSISLKNIEVCVFVVGQNSSLKEMLQLHTPHAKMDMDLNGISRNKINQGHAAVAFMSYTNMSNLSLFNANTFNTTKCITSAVVSATLPKTKNRSLDTPVNFTLKHLKALNPNYVHSCVYWNETDWVTDGCTLTTTNSSHTVCSSTHLSTFALIMQINPCQSEHRFEVINMVVVSFGLVFLGLALLTFALCRKNPRVINTARINLYISLLLGHLLFLLTQTLVKKKYQLACAVLAGIVHFLFLSAFVWMFIEALMLFLAIKNLSRPKSKHKEVLNWKLLTSVGYMVALVVVGMSAGVVPDGYSSEECWLTTSKGFNWSFLGPVFFILASNMILFSLIAISLRSSLARLNSQVSQIKQTRTIFFKTMAQFVIFGCPWILGVFTANSEALEIIFLILNSQQGTFIFIVHCVLSKEVRQKYRKLLCGSCVTTYYESSGESTRLQSVFITAGPKSR